MKKTVFSDVVTLIKVYAMIDTVAAALVKGVVCVYSATAIFSLRQDYDLGRKKTGLYRVQDTYQSL